MEVVNDCWLPRLYVLGQVAVVAVCGVLIALGKDSVITDLFCAAGGGLILTGGYQKIVEKLKAKEVVK